MKRSFLFTMAIAASLALAPFSSARAADAALTGPVVEQFIQTLPDLKAFSDQMQKEGKGDALEQSFNANSSSMSASDFSPYSAGVAALKSKFPADYASLGTLVAKHGFNSQESWAAAGNEVVKSYMALKMEAAGPDGAAAIQKISPDMLAKLPPQMQAQVEQSKRMMDAAATVPAADKEAMRPYVGEFETWAQKAAAEGTASSNATATAPAQNAAAVKSTVKGIFHKFPMQAK